MRTLTRTAPLILGIAAASLVATETVYARYVPLAQEKVAPQQAPMIKFVPLQPHAIVAPGKEAAFTVTLPAGTATGATMIWEARNLDDAVVAKGEEKVGTTDAAIRFTPREPGIVYLRATVKNAAGATVAEGDTRAAVFVPRDAPVPAAPILWAVSSHLHGLSPKDAAREIEVMRLTGFAGCRFDLSWGAVQPERDVYKWDLYDRIFAEFDRNKVMPLPLIGYSTRWASTGDINGKDWREWGNAPPKTDAYVSFTQNLVGRYGKYTKYWEIWNEPDISFWRGTPEQYAELSNASVKAIHAADPAAKVMNGGFSETRRRPDFIPRYLALANPKPDIYAFHTHGPLPNLVRAEEHLKEYFGGAGWAPGSVPVWLNEAGFSSTRGATERQQAVQLVKKMSFAPAIGCSAYVWYDLRNDGTDPSENEHNFGLIRNDFSPKASLVAAHTLMEALGGKKFVKRLDMGTGRYALLYAGKNEQTLVYWNEAGGAGSQTSQLLRTRATGARTRSMMGAEKPIPAGKGVVTAVLTAEPQFLILTGGNGALDAAPAVIDAPASVVAAPGASSKVRLTVTNPLSTALQGDLNLSVPAGWRVTPSRVPLNLKSAEKKTVDAEVSASASGSSGVLKIHLASAALPQPAEAAATLGLAQVAGRTPTRMATLSGRESTVSLFEATPMTELHFRGPEDLSAEVTLGYDDHNILLGVRVRDDKHVQSEALNDLWKGDSVQFALATPDGQHYEWMTALTASGPRLVVGIAPPQAPRGEQPTDTVTIRRDGDITEHQIRIPDTLPGVREMLAQGGGINVLVNDNDGQGRKGWVEWSPGIGRDKAPALFPRVIFTGK